MIFKYLFFCFDFFRKNFQIKIFFLSVYMRGCCIKRCHVWPTPQSDAHCREIIRLRLTSIIAPFHTIFQPNCHWASCFFLLCIFSGKHRNIFQQCVVLSSDLTQNMVERWSLYHVSACSLLFDCPACQNDSLVLFSQCSLNQCAIIIIFKNNRITELDLRFLLFFSIRKSEKCT